MKESNKIPDSISKAGNKLPFSIPDNYFDELPSRIQQRILKEEYKPVGQKIMAFIRPQLALAAMIIGFVIIGYAGLKLILNNKNEKNVNEITEIINYYIYEFDEDLFIDAVLESDKELIYTADNGALEELYNYLYEDDIDLSVLLNDY